jgi:hypothetical protein
MLFPPRTDPTRYLAEGSTGLYTLRLTNGPLANVLVTVLPTCPSLTVTPNNVAFSPSNWSSPAIVTVTSAVTSVAHVRRGWQLEHACVRVVWEALWNAVLLRAGQEGRRVAHTPHTRLEGHVRS